MTKTQQIESHLKSGKSITGIEALSLYGCYRLSSVIHNLRRKMNIETIMMEHDDGTTYARYKAV